MHHLTDDEEVPVGGLPDPDGVGRRTVLVGALLGLAGVALSACGSEAATTAEGDDEAPDPPAVTVAPDGTQVVTLHVQDDYVFVPDVFTVAPGRVRITVRSVAEQLTHNFRFTPDAGPAPIEPEIPILAPGESDTIDFEVDAEGDYRFECSFHVALGQIGTMTVVGA